MIRISDLYADVLRLRIKVLDVMQERINTTIALHKHLTFQSGDVVRVQEKHARAMMATKRCRVDWASRRGVVVSSNKYDVTVRWQGRLSLDKHSIRVMEKVNQD